MLKYESNVTAEQAVKQLSAARRVVITTHAKPDGDAYGSVVALAGALRARGAQVDALLVPPVHPGFHYLPGYDDVTVLDADKPIAWPDADLYVIVDTGAWSQLHPLRPHIEKNLENTLIIDHHIMGDVEAKSRYIDHAAAACCEVVAELIDLISGGEARYDDTVASALFVGIASDTGWFKFSNTRPRTHQLAARLLEQGVNHADLFSLLEQNERVEKLRLMIRALDSLELLADQQAAMMVLRAEDFAETGANLEETERFVDAPQAVETVQVVVMVTEPPRMTSGNGGDGLIRLSFRSKPGPAAVNVAGLAGQFGGGGHARAAGAKVEGTLDSVVARVREAVASCLVAP